MTPAPATGGSESYRSSEEIPDSRLVGRPLVIMLDVDGTLAPIAMHPSLASVAEPTRRVIASLASRDGVSVALVSGRAAQDARRLVAVENVWTIGNHGAELMDPRGEIIVDADVAPYGESMARAARALQPLLAPLRGVFLENKGWTLSVHFRAADAAIVPKLRAAVDGEAMRGGLRVTEGKMVFEIRPPVRVDKGTSVLRLARDLGGMGNGAALLFAGDDVTDEDAFRLLRSHVPRAVTIHVGERPDTAAEFTLGDPDDVLTLLQRIADLNESRS
jgi:trehalose-phosphatase